ncbi:MAG: ABC transporter ATP-binding protein [Bacillota bacterium]|nr:ABC transporter ATP-binding protein [Bacillota bacterium]MDI7250341.1 ABC transporter ATP-binding protein [Bacillota bacterium]
MSVLKVEGMTHYFGGLRAVYNYNLEIEMGQIRGLIGPNGAGKTTIFNLITGMYRPTSGRIVFDGQDIVGLPPHRIAARGIGRTFQNMMLWRHMTVLEHVKLAHYSRIDYGLVGAFLGTPRRHRQEAEIEERSYELLRMMGVDRFAQKVITELPYGAQRRVEIARALATQPKLLLLDEPTAGMNPEEMIEMVDTIRRIHGALGMAIFLIEHRMRVVMDLCETIQTLNFGEVIAEGTPDEIRNNPVVIEAYLGKEVVT